MKNVEIRFKVTFLDDIRKVMSMLYAQDYVGLFNQKDSYYVTIPKIGSENHSDILSKEDRRGCEFCQEMDRQVLRIREENYRVEITESSGKSIKVLDNVEMLKKKYLKKFEKVIVIDKVRDLYVIGQTNIYLDTVSKLGDFVKLSCSIREGQTVEDGQKILSDWIETLSLNLSTICNKKYIDIIES